MASPLVLLPDTPPMTPDRVPSPMTLGKDASGPPTPPELHSASTGLWSSWALDRPLSTLLREATAIAHERVQRSPVVESLVRGEIPKELHTRYLIMLFHIYTTLEAALATYADDEVLAPTHNPALLSRADALANDIALFTGDVDWRSSSPLAKDYRLLGSRELEDYVDRIRSLLDTSSPFTPPKNVICPPPSRAASQLLAHSYVRYMGDLSGGQTIARAVETAYGLEQNSMSFYRFGTLERPDEEAGASEMKRIKAWFRQGMDLGGSFRTEAQKADIMQEALYAFELNVRLFASFAKYLDMDTSLPDVSITPSSPVRSAFAKASTYSAGLSKRPKLEAVPIVERRSSCPFHTATTSLPAVITQSQTTVSPTVIGLAGLSLFLALYIALRSA